MPERWFCKKCGHCCKHQHIRMDMHHTQIHLFPKKSYLPYLGYGDSKSDITVIEYKMIGKRCPLYDDNIGCTIYEDRPIICRKFPFASDPRNPAGIGLDVGCKNSPKGEEVKGVSKEFMDSMQPIFEAGHKQFMEAIDKFETTKLWVYKNFKWRIVTKEKLEKMQRKK